MACCNPFDISGHDWSSPKEPTLSMAVQVCSLHLGQRLKKWNSIVKRKPFPLWTNASKTLVRLPSPGEKPDEKTTLDKKSKNSPKHCRTLRLETMEVKKEKGILGKGSWCWLSWGSLSSQHTMIASVGSCAHLLSWMLPGWVRVLPQNCATQRWLTYRFGWERYWAADL